VRVAEVVAVRVRDEDDVDLAQARIGPAHHGPARVVEHARAARVFEDERTVLRAEFAVESSERRHFHGLREHGDGGERRDGAQRCDAGESIGHCLLLVG
jgi:hypothetical protein